jgi:hypothetical protein
MNFCTDSQFGGMDPFLLLPSTKGQWRRAAATVQSDQRGVEVLDGSLLWFEGVYLKYLVRQRFCMKKMHA